MATAEQLEKALRAADAAGNTEDAKKLAQAWKAMQGAPKVNLGNIAAGRAQAIGDIAGKAGGAVDRFAKMGDEATHMISTAQTPEGINPVSPDIDRKGLPFEQASLIMAADNAAEKAKALKSIDPRATMSRDYRGREYVTMGDGRKVYVEPYGEGMGGMAVAEGKTMGEQAYARPGETTGAIVGGAMGGGPGGAMVGAGAAGSIGYLIDQAVKASAGRYAKTPGQLALGAGESAAMNAGGELIGRAPGAVMRGGLPRAITGSTPEKEEFGRTMLKGGAAPGMGAGAPGLASVQWKINLGKKLGLPETDKRVQALASDIENFLGGKGVAGDKSTGFPANRAVKDVAGTINPTLGGKTPRVGGEEQYGKTLTDPMVAKRQALEAGVAMREQQNKLLDDQMKQAKAAATKAVDTLRTGQGPTASDFRSTVADDLMAARKARSDEFQPRYAKLAEVEQGLATNMAEVANHAQQILEALPKDPTGKPLVANEQMLPKIQFLMQVAQTKGDMPIAQAAALRSQINGLNVRTLLPTTKQYLMTDLNKTLDSAIKLSGSHQPEAVATGRHQIASTMRQQIEKDYATASRKLDDNLAARLIKEAGKRGSVDADDVIPLMSRSPGQFKRIWGLLQPEARRRVGRGLFDDMVGRATKNGEISGQDLVDQLTKNAGVLRDVYGKDAPKMIQAARALQALDGKLPLNARLMPENVVQALETAATTQREMDKFFKNHALASLVPDQDPGKAALATAQKEVAERAAARSAPVKPVPATAAERETMRSRINDAASRVGTTADKRIELAKARVEGAKKELKSFDEGQFAKLADPAFLKDNAVNYIIQPGQLDLLQKAVSLYGPGSEQVKGLQEAFLRKAVASGTRDVTDPKRAFGGEGIRDFLKKYTPEQKAILLEPYGGEAGLQKLSRFYDFAFPVSEADVSAGLAGGGLKSKISPVFNIFKGEGWANIARYGKAYLTAYVLSSPAAYKLLVTGFDYPNKPIGKAALMALDNGLRAYVQTSASQGKLMGSPPAPQQ